MSSIINAITNTDTVASICIPRVFDNIGEDRVRNVFQKLNIFEIGRVDIIQKQNDKGDKFKRIFIHIKEWFKFPDAVKAKERLASGKDLKIVYDDPWFWKISMNKWTPKPSAPQVPVSKPKIRIEFDIVDDEDDNQAKNKEAASQFLESLELEDNRSYKERRNDPQYRRSGDNRPCTLESKYERPRDERYEQRDYRPRDTRDEQHDYRPRDTRDERYEQRDYRPRDEQRDYRPRDTRDEQLDYRPRDTRDEQRDYRPRDQQYQKDNKKYKDNNKKYKDNNKKPKDNKKTKDNTKQTKTDIEEKDAAYQLWDEEEKKRNVLEEVSTKEEITVMSK